MTKKTFLKKGLSVLTAVTIASAFTTGIPFSELGLGITVSAAEIVSNGTCDAEGNESSMTWSLDSDNTLIISGSGAMWDYSTANIGSQKQAPWYEHKDNITTVIIEEGVTTIGTYAF